MGTKTNQYKESGDAPEKSSTKQKAGKSGKLFRPFAFLADERFQKAFGLFMLLLSVFLLISFASYVFTWKADQSQVLKPVWEFLTDGTIKVDNWLGKFGALSGHLIIYKGFGIASFLWVLIVFLIGFKILFEAALLPISKTIQYSIFTFLWLSTTLSFAVRSPEWLFLGGAFGFHARVWLEGMMGILGTGFLIAFVSIGFAAIVFNVSFKDMLASKETEQIIPEIEESDESVGNTLAVDDVEEVEELVESPTNELEIDIEEPAPDESWEPEIIEKQDNVPIAEEIILGADGDVPLSVAAMAADEAISENGESLLKTPLGEYDPTLELSSYQFPTLDLLELHSAGKPVLSVEDRKAELEENKNKIVETLGHYNIGIEKIKATIGPTVTLFEIVPSAGVRISKIKNLEDDIALSLAALGIRIIAPIPGKGTIGIEVPNQKPEMVPMRAILASEKFQNADLDLPIALGKTITNEVFVTDLAKMPHLLMAGATGQGKSVGLNAILVSLLYKKHPSQIKFVLVDPKKVELTLFKKIERHFLAKLPNEEEAIITDTKKVVNTLNSLCIEMDQRYDLLKDAQVRNIKEYNAKFISRKLNPNEGHRFLPYIVLVVDEFADLIMTAGKEVETPIARLAQLARAIGIHLIIATQRPSVNIITGTIKANFPARIAFRVTSKVDSRTILDSGGADQLIGRGDMLLSTGAELIRIQCAFVDTPEVEKVCDFIGSQRGYSDAMLLPEYIDPTSEAGLEISLEERDDLFDAAARIVVQTQQGSASLLQRKLKLGYNRAGRIVDQLEAAGIIGKFEGSKARDVLIKDEMSLEQYLNDLKQRSAN